MKNPKSVAAGKKAWKGKRQNWFVAEKKYKELLKKEGSSILAHRGGYPDFMYEKDGNICFTEVKRGNDLLQENQKKVMNILRKAGFDVKLLRYQSTTDSFEEDKTWIE